MVKKTVKKASSSPVKRHPAQAVKRLSSPAGPEKIQEDLLPLAIDIDSPVLNPRNAREHPEENLDQIKLSLMVYGQCKPVVINKNTGIIEAGNGMVLSARALGWKRIAVARADHDAVQAMAYGIMDNKSGLSSTWNLPVLKDNLLELDTGQIPMACTGFTDGEIEELMTQVHQEPPVKSRLEDNLVPEPPAKATSRPGDTWTLGAHRLTCGDCTDPAIMKRLLDGATPDMVFTNPPYGINLVHGDGHVGGGARACRPAIPPDPRRREANQPDLPPDAGPGDADMGR